MLSGNTVILRAIKNEDINFLSAFRMDLDLQIQLMARARPHSANEMLMWFDKKNSSDNAVLFIIAEKTQDQAVGIVQLDCIDYISGHASMGLGLISDKRGLGYGQESIELIENYALSILRIRKLILQVLSDNSRAIELYTKVGFSAIGVLSRHFYNKEKYSDVTLMEKIL